MNILPIGITRVSQNQRARDPMQIGTQPIPELGSMIDDINQNKQPLENTPESGVDNEIKSIDNVPPIDTQSPTDTQPIITDKKNTLTDYIFEKLTSFGYPGRRLDDFKKEFVTENISPDGTKDKVVTIPDKYYPDQSGVTKSIEDDDLRTLIQEINKKFGLHFNGAKRAQGKWTIMFTSANPSPDQGEQPITGDNLDEVYGTPTQKNKNRAKNAPVRAFTIDEMIKTQKDNIVDNLKKIIGDKNA